jgi:hypothetical protein
MSRLISSLGVALVFATLSGRAALADSDGYFCVGPGYVAYEAAGLDIPATGHVLFLVNVGGPEGIAEPIAVQMDAFQAGAMHCGEDLIVFDGGYTIDISDRQNPKYLGVRQSTATEGTIASGNITMWPYAGAYAIPTSDGNHYYSLVIAHVEEVVEQDYGSFVLHHMTAKVVEIENSTGRLVRSRILHDGVSVETVD